MAPATAQRPKRKAQRDEYGGVVTMLGGEGVGGDAGPDADPTLSAPTKAVAATPEGQGQGQDDLLTSLFNAGGDAVGSLATGVGKGIARMGVGAGQMINKAVLPGVSEMIMPGALDQAEAVVQPQGVMEKLGYLGSHAAGVGAGAMVTGGSSLLGQIGAGAAGAGVMEGAASGGDLKSMLMAAATGGAGRAIPALSAMKKGVGALGEGGKDAAKARLPELMDEISAAQQKGAVPGHGMIPKVLAEERDSLLRMLAEDAVPAAKNAVEQAPSNIAGAIPPWVIKALLGAAGTGLAGKMIKGAMKD